MFALIVAATAATPVYAYLSGNQSSATVAALSHAQNLMSRGEMRGEDIRLCAIKFESYNYTGVYCSPAVDTILSAEPGRCVGLLSHILKTDSSACYPLVQDVITTDPKWCHEVEESKPIRFSEFFAPQSALEYFRYFVFSAVWASALFVCRSSIVVTRAICSCCKPTKGFGSDEDSTTPAPEFETTPDGTIVAVTAVVPSAPSALDTLRRHNNINNTALVARSSSSSSAVASRRVPTPPPKRIACCYVNVAQLVSASLLLATLAAVGLLCIYVVSRVFFTRWQDAPRNLLERLWGSYSEVAYTQQLMAAFGLTFAGIITKLAGGVSYYFGLVALALENMVYAFRRPTSGKKSSVKAIAVAADANSSSVVIGHNNNDNDADSDSEDS